jgi:chromosome segregation ATPase
VGSLHTVLSSTDVREQPLSVIALGSLDAALCRCEEALAQDSDAYQPEEEQEADGSTSRCARELREAQLRVRKYEAEVQELRERDAQRQTAERDRIALRNRVELLESKLEGICAVAEPEALPIAFDALASVDKKEREVEKLEVARIRTELEDLRKSRWAAVAPSLTNIPSIPAEEWGALAELLEQFAAAATSEDPCLLSSRARELSSFCTLAASALRGRPAAGAASSLDMVAALRLDLAHARRGWAEARAKLVAKPPRPVKLTLAHMECCLRAEELEQRLRFDVNASSRARAMATDGENTTEQLEDLSARCARLEIELDNLNVDYQNKIDSLNEATASIEQYKISNRNFLREAAECRAQLTVSQDSQQKEMDLYLNRISSLSQELDAANRKLREVSRGGDPLTSTTASVSATGASLTEKIATDAAREEADRLRAERGLIDAHLGRIADAMGLTAVGTADLAARLSELLVRAA